MDVTRELPTTNDLGFITSIEIIEQELSLDQKSLIDAGCGGLDFTKCLLEKKASVLAIDPDAVQAKINRESAPIPNLEFIEAGAEKIPAENDSIDGVFFSFSLHHIPSELYPLVFEEVIRVLRPNGYLCVIEPMSCPLNDVMKLFHNEDQERLDAIRAIAEFGLPAFETAKRFEYHSFIEYDSFDHFADRFSSRSFNTLYSPEDVRKPAVEKAFEQHAPEYRFRSPKQMIILQGLKQN